MIPAIILRRLEGETDEQFSARRSACRNEAARQGFSTPEKFCGNVFDENTFEEGVIDKIKQWPLVMVYDFGDLADTRDELAERLALIQGSGSNVMSVSEKIDLRGVDAEGAAAARAFGIWMGLAGTENALQRLIADNDRMIAELEGKLAARDKDALDATKDATFEKVNTILGTPPDWTPDQEAVVRERLASHGTEKPAELAKLIGIHWMTAKSWLAYAAANPIPGPDNTDGE